MAQKKKTNIDSIYGMAFQEYIQAKKSDTTLQFQFEPFFTNQRLFLKGFGKFLFYTFLIGYMISPIFIVPLISYHFDNSYLLFGLIFSYLSTYLAIRKKQWQWAAPLLFIFWYWYKNGFIVEDYITFFWLCLIWGGWMYSISVRCEEEFAKITIQNDSNLFDKLSQKGIILCMRKTENVQMESPATLLQMGLREIKVSNNFENAINYFDKAIKIAPNYTKLYFNRGLAMFSMENFETACLDFDTAIKLSPKDGVGYYGRAFSNFKLGNIEAAKPDYNKAKNLGVNTFEDWIKNMD